MWTCFGVGNHGRVGVKGYRIAEINKTCIWLGYDMGTPQMAFDPHFGPNAQRVDIYGLPASVCTLMINPVHYCIFLATQLFGIYLASAMTSEKAVNFEGEPRNSLVHVENAVEEKQIERISTSDVNLVYDDNDEEPELHARTYFALAAMFLLNLVQVFALQGPPAVVCYGGSVRLN